MNTLASVKIWNQLVGVVMWDEKRRQALFEFDKSFAKTNWDLAPMLPFVLEIFSTPSVVIIRVVVVEVFKEWISNTKLFLRPYRFLQCWSGPPILFESVFEQIYLRSDFVYSLCEKRHRIRRRDGF